MPSNKIISPEVNRGVTRLYKNRRLRAGSYHRQQPVTGREEEKMDIRYLGGLTFLKGRNLGLIIFFTLIFAAFATFLHPDRCLSAPYYEGKVIRIIVGHEVAGGYDRMARLIARHIRKYIPGVPSIIVENMPGASSIIAANYIYTLTKPDGLTIGALDRGLPFAQLLKAEGVKFDMVKFSWIGSMAEETAILAIRTSLPYKTFGDLEKAKQPIYLGITSPAASGAQFGLLLREFLKIDLKTVIYPSSAAIALAIERKEADARGGSYSSFKPAIDQGLVRAVIRGRVSEPGIENLPVRRRSCYGQSWKDDHGHAFRPRPRGPAFRGLSKYPCGYYSGLERCLC